MKVIERLIDRLAPERFDIGRPATGLYLTRWTLLGRRSVTPWAVFLHRFAQSDHDVAHDHPWGFVSVILSGGYWEESPAPGWRGGVEPMRRRWYGPGRILCRPAHWIHRVVLPPGRDCWTLVLRFKKSRSWGFWCRSGWVPWREFEARLDAGAAVCPDD